MCARCHESGWREGASHKAPARFCVYALSDPRRNAQELCNSHNWRGGIGEGAPDSEHVTAEMEDSPFPTAVSQAPGSETEEDITVTSWYSTRSRLPRRVL